MAYTCPVCGYPNLRYPPADYVICPSCGTEFEYHDALRSHEALRQQWVNRLAPWHSSVIPKPVDWNPYFQLISAGLRWAVPFDFELELLANFTIAGSGVQLEQSPVRIQLGT